MLAGILYGLLLVSLSLLSFTVIPLFGFTYLLAWYGRKRNIFQLPSSNRNIRFLQCLFLTLLAAVLLANLAIRVNVFAYCFDREYVCPIDNPDRPDLQAVIGIRVIPDTIPEWEAIIKYLIPRSMRETCYIGNELACEAASRYMIDRTYENPTPYPSIWILAVAHALAVLAIMRRVFPDQRKQKREMN